MKLKLALTALCAAAMTLPQTAKADWVSGCGGNSFLMCNAWNLVSLGSGNYSLYITNTSNAPTQDGSIKDFVLGNSTAGSFTITKLSGGDWGAWDIFNGDGTVYSGQGLTNQIFIGTTSGNLALDTGYGILLSFHVEGANFDPAQIGFHEISGPNGCSSKGVFNIETGVTATQLDPQLAANCGGTTVPEPATMALVGTGIAGILAARRRRKLTKA